MKKQQWYWHLRRDKPALRVPVLIARTAGTKMLLVLPHGQYPGFRTFPDCLTPMSNEEARLRRVA